MWLSFIEKKSTFHHHLCAVLLFLPSSYTFLIFFAWMQINWILAFRDNVDEILFLCPPCLSRLFHLPLFFPPSLPVFLFFICPPSSSPLFLLSFFFYQQFILDRKKTTKRGRREFYFLLDSCQRKFKVRGQRRRKASGFRVNSLSLRKAVT